MYKQLNGLFNIFRQNLDKIYGEMKTDDRLLNINNNIINVMEKRESEIEVKSVYKLSDIGTDCIIQIALFIHGDKYIHNFISTCNNFYMQKKYIQFYGYYPIFLNLNLPFKSISAKILCSYNVDIPQYIKRLEIVGTVNSNFFDAEEIIIDLEKTGKSQDMTIVNAMTNATHTIPASKYTLKFSKNLKKLYIKNCPASINIDLSDCTNLNFLGLNTNLIKKRISHDQYLNNMAGTQGGHLAPVSAQVVKNRGGGKTYEFKETDREVTIDNEDLIDIIDDDDLDNENTENIDDIDDIIEDDIIEGKENEEDDKNGIYSIINIKKLKFNKKKIQKLYLFMDDLDFKINNVNEFILNFPNLKHLTIDGQYRTDYSSKSYQWLIMDNSELLRLPNGIKVCKLKPNILLHNFPSSLDKLFVKHSVPISCDLDYKFKVIKLDYIDEKLLR